MGGSAGTGLEAERLIEILGLTPHPEGGFFREIFRSPLRLEGLPGKRSRNASTSIYYLLAAGTFSAFHLVRGADEIWHHYLGVAVDLHTLSEGDGHHVARLGSDVARGERPQVVVAAGTLQAAVPAGNGHALCGCTVAPGFDFADFAVPKREELLRAFPGHRGVIERLTRE